MRVKRNIMTTRHLIDPELVAILDQIPASELTTEALPQIRAMSSPSFANLAQSPAISISERLIPGPEGAPDVRVLVYKPTTAQEAIPALLWIHGGGYIMGSANAEDFMAK